MAVDGLAAAEIALGSLMAWSAVTNASVTASVRTLLRGRPPQPDTGGQPIAPAPAAAQQAAAGAVYQNGPPPGPATVAAYKAYAQVMLAAHGWPGQWAALSAIVGEEDASWDPTARNPDGGALGIAQALNHGDANTAGKYGNEYGGYGVPDAVAKAANNGNGYAQIEWMLTYIGQTYGSPDAAQAFHLANGYY